MILFMTTLIPFQAADLPSEGVLAWSTLVLALATVVLVIVGCFSLRASLKQIKVASEAAILSATGAKDLALKDHKRRRGEATMAAADHFNKIFDKHHKILITCARKDGIGIPALLSREMDPDISDALQAQLDAAEMLSLGARYGIFDYTILYQMIRSPMLQLERWSKEYVDEVRIGKGGRRAQESAYEHFSWLMGEFAKKAGAGKPPLEGTLTL